MTEPTIAGKTLQEIEGLSFPALSDGSDLA